MEPKIGIITDSTCDLPGNITAENGIEVIPLRIIYSDQEYRDGVDITADEVYAALDEKQPTTSLPHPEDVAAVFQTMKTQGYTHIIALHLSSALSGTAQMIRTMAEDTSGIVVRVIDSKSISMGLGFMVMEAAEAAARSESFEAVCDHIAAVRQRLSVYFVLETLEYLKRGGRIGRVAGTLGQLLNVKPIITVNEEGIYTTFAKVLGRRPSISKLLEIARTSTEKAASRIAVCHGGAAKEAEYFAAKAKAFPNLEQLIVSHVSPVIGVHTGPGTLGFAVLTSAEHS